MQLFCASLTIMRPLLVSIFAYELNGVLIDVHAMFVCYPYS